MSFFIFFKIIPIKNKVEFKIRGILIIIGFLLNSSFRFFVNIFISNLTIKYEQEIVIINIMKKNINIRKYDDN